MREVAGPQRLKEILKASQQELIAAIREEWPSTYIIITQRHLGWLRGREVARSLLSEVSERLGHYPFGERPLYGFSRTREPNAKLSETQKGLFEEGSMSRLVFSARYGNDEQRGNKLS